MFTENIFLTNFGFVSINVTTTLEIFTVRDAQKEIKMKSNRIGAGLKINPNKRSKKGGYIVDGYLKDKDANGKLLRVRKTFSGPNAKDLARAYINEKIIEDSNSAADTTIRKSKLDDEFEFGVLDLVKRIRKELKDDESDPIDLLTKAVDNYLQNPARGSAEISVNDARREYESRDNFDTTSDSHKKIWKTDLDRFCGTYGDRQIATITIDEIKAWIDRDENRSVERKRLDRAHLHALFNWARKQSYLSVNVVTAYELPRANRREPVSLSIEQAHNLLHFSTKVNGGQLTPYFALAIFAGLRPFEIKRALWEDIDWDEGFIRARQRKGNDFTRAVELPEICVEWLEHCKGRKKSGLISPANFDKNFAVVRAAAGFRLSMGNISSCDWWGLDKFLENSADKSRPKWVNDICRHTAISYRLRVVKHIGEVAEWAGNSPDIINKNYRSVKNVTKKSTEAFYKLTPKTVKRSTRRLA